MKSSDAKNACPCGTGLPYATCCRPLHRGEREADDATALMRSRYSAFVKKEVEYLWKTLHASHHDRQGPKEQTLRDLRDACGANRYMGLRILDVRDPDGGKTGVARVLFEAKIFHRGSDRSFVELSDFERDPAAGNAWRYARGDGAMLAQFPEGTSELTIDAFLKLAH